VAGVLNRFRAALRLFRAEGCDVLVLLGDLTHLGDDESRSAVLTACDEEWTGPVLVVPGNHDPAEVGCPGDVDVVRNHLPQIAFNRVLLEARSSRARFEDELESLRARVSVVVSHYPLLSRRSFIETRGFRYAGDLENRDELVDDLLGRPGPTLVLCGHLHVRESFVRGSILQLSIASIVEPPYECNVLDLDMQKADSGSVIRTAVPLARPGPEQNVPVFAREREGWAWNSDGVWCPLAMDCEPNRL
jgi:predicted phosphodiesterase